MPDTPEAPTDTPDAPTATERRKPKRRKTLRLPTPPQMSGIAAARRSRRVVLVWVVVALSVVGAACLTVALVWEPSPTGREHDIHEFFVAVWPVCITLVFAVVLYEFWLRRWFVMELVSVSGPMVIQALRPRETLRVLLDFVYGAKGQNRDVVTGVLGGFGEAADHRDLSISQSTAVQLTLADTAISASYELTIKASHSFGDRTPPDDLYVFFVTTDPKIRDLLAVACDRPLFDYWYFPGTTDLEPELAKLKDTLKVTVDYKDAEGVLYPSHPFTPALHEVEPNEWHTYLRIFREDLGTQRQLIPEEHKDTLAILTFNFGEALDKEDFVWERICGVEVESTTTQAKDDGYCYWAATYPCLVTEIAFDVSRLTGIYREDLVFRKAPFLLRAHLTRDEWSRHPQPLRPGTWLLAGHGVALIWRSAWLELQASKGNCALAVTAGDSASGVDNDSFSRDGAGDNSGTRIPIAESVGVPLEEIWRHIVARLAVGQFGSSADITSRRRDTDRLAAMLVMPATADRVEGSALDDPWWRFAVAAAKKGGEAQMLDEVSKTLAHTTVPGNSARRAPDPPQLWDGSRAPKALRQAFEEVIERTFKQNDGNGWSGGVLEVKETASGSPPRNATESGWQLLSDKAPELLDTLANHVACIAWTTLHSFDTTFQSGTLPDLPGTVLLSVGQTENKWYFPEAFVHEAAHCKFFDLCLARNIVGALDPGGAQWRMEAPWVDETNKRAKSWPLDQALAAAHAYLHVAILAGSLAAAATDAATESHWNERCAVGVQRAELLLSELGDAPLSTLGADGLDFVDWMQGLVQLVRNVATHVAQGWSETGPVVRVSSEVKTLRASTSEYSLIGVVATGNAMMLPSDLAEYIEAGAPMTVGDLAVAKLAAGATSPAEALVEAFDIVGALDAMGIVEFEHKGVIKSSGEFRDQ